MSYLLNTVNIITYGIIPGHANNSNIALSGCFDLPKRSEDCYKDWGDEDGIEPYTDADEIFFEGRDITFYGSIFGTNSVVNSYLKSLYDAIKAFTDLVVFSTPYGNFSVQLKDIKVEQLNGGARITILFREPVVTLAGGTLPAVGSNSYTIDSIPFSSFGFYLSKTEALNDLPDLKEQFFTKHGSEGYQISKRKNNTLNINGFIIADSLSDFQDKIKALYLLFSSSGTRTINLNSEKTIVCFATEGFNVENIILYDNKVIANFKINLLCESVSRYKYSDCFLPSKDELNTIYNELYLHGIGGYDVNDALYFWSSTEYDWRFVWIHRFDNNSLTYSNKGPQTLRFIPCRKFTSTTNYNLRDVGPAGGHIFWKSGNDYMEAISFIDNISVWSNIQTVEIGASAQGTAIGTGQANTLAIISQVGHTDSAAKLCDDLEI
jgi:hypothetical protein